MQCREENCEGQINFAEQVSLQTGCTPFSQASACACDTCGRLHWPNGEPVFDRAGNKAIMKQGSVQLVPVT